MRHSVAKREFVKTTRPALSITRMPSAVESRMAARVRRLSARSRSTTNRWLTSCITLTQAGRPSCMIGVEQTSTANSRPLRVR